MIKIFIHTASWLVLCLTCNMASALSLSVPKALIDSGVAKKFPKEKLTITLDNPKTNFIRASQKIEVCGTWASKLPKQDGEFCIDFKPQWNKGKGHLEMSSLNILKLTAGESSKLSDALKSTLNTTVLTLLDGTSIYQVPDMVGKHLESIEVQENSFKLVF